jgi:hypothetical protein
MTADLASFGVEFDFGRFLFVASDHTAWHHLNNSSKTCEVLVRQSASFGSVSPDFVDDNMSLHDVSERDCHSEQLTSTLTHAAINTHQII